MFSQVPSAGELMAFHVVSTLEMKSIENPNKASIIYNSDDNLLYQFNGKKWNSIGSEKGKLKLISSDNSVIIKKDKKNYDISVPGGTSSSNPIKAYGKVSSNGVASIISGATVSRVRGGGSKGVYRITFDEQRKSENYVVQLTGIRNGVSTWDPVVNCNVIFQNKNYFEIGTYEWGNTLVNSGFYFTVIE